MNKNLFSKFNWRGGQSLLEAVLALAIFAFIAGALVTTVTGSFISLNYGRDYLEAVTLADEALEAARSVRDGAWNELVLNTAVATSSSGEWRLLNGASETLGKFTRTLTFAPGSGGPSDLHAKLVSAKVVWSTEMGVEQEVARQTYLTNWDSRDWIHTDWTGLAGTNVDTSVAGQLTLAGIPAAWATTTATAGHTWNDVWTFTDKDAWAVGNSGAIGRFNGTSWTLVVPSPTNRNLNAIYCPTSSTCFAVGQSGTILQLTGGEWKAMPSTTGQALNGLYCLSATSCFAAGASGTILKLTGSAWALHRDTGNETWNDLWMFSDSSGFVVGASGFIWRLNGSAGSNWALNQDTGSQTWNDIWMYGPASGIVVGTGGQVRRYRGGSDWSSNDGTGLTGTWNAVWMASDTSGWAVGNNASGELIYQRTPSGWVRLTLPVATLPNVNLFGVHCANVDVCFASGASGNIFRRSGGGFATSGSLISPAFDMSDNSSVQILDWTETGCGGCDIQVRVRSGDSGSGPWSAWTSWFGNPLGAILPTLLNGRRWVQYETALTGPGTATPVLQEVRINYK